MQISQWFAGLHRSCSTAPLGCTPIYLPHLPLSAHFWVQYDSTTYSYAKCFHTRKSRVTGCIASNSLLSQLEGRLDFSFSTKYEAWWPGSGVSFTFHNQVQLEGQPSTSEWFPCTPNWVSLPRHQDLVISLLSSAMLITNPQHALIFVIVWGMVPWKDHSHGTLWAS